MNLPSLLLVPGAWHNPNHWAPLVVELSGIDVHTVALTSVGDDPATLKDMYADAEVIAKAVAAIDRPVVVLAHSYGGVPATQALSDVKNVERIIYLAAFQLDVGEAVLMPNVAPWSRGPSCTTATESRTTSKPRHRRMFYNDVDTITAVHAASQLGYQSYASMRQPLVEAAWKSIPSTYIICEADNAIPVAAQERMAEHADEVLRLGTSHSPFLSQPASLARLIRRCLAAARMEAVPPER